MRNTYLFLGASLISTLFVLESCKNKSIPDKMPADFKIEFHSDGGMLNEHRNIIIQMGESTDEGRYEEEAFEYKFTITDTKELEDLYNNLKKLNAYTLKYKDVGHEDDGGGESVHYRINGKDYKVSNSNSNFIKKEDADAFTKSIEFIVWFAESYRKPEMAKISTTESTESNPGIVVEETETSKTVIINKKEAPKTTPNNDNMMKGSILETFQNKGISAKMPDDFKIQYENNGGISGTYRNIIIQFGSCTDEGKKSGEAKYTESWINMNLKEYESLYNGLYKLNAFTLEYTSKGEVADRGGESIKFTINKKEYVVSDKDNNYIKASDKAAFKKAIGLILAYTDKN